MVKQAKPGFFSLGIRQKVGFVLVTVLLLSLGLSGWYSLRQQEERILEETKLRGSDLINFTAQSVVYGVVGYDYHSLQLLIDELVKSQDINYAKIINTKGNIMAKAGRLSTQSASWTFFEQDIVFDETVVGSLSIQLDNSRIVKKFAERRNDLILREIMLIILIAIGEYLALSYFIIRPICMTSNKLKSNIDEAGMLYADIPYNKNDELGHLFSHFQTMQARLNETTNQLKSKVELANREVQEKNNRLQIQSDELRIINDKLKQLTITDPLTELYNRRHFDIVLKKEMSFAQRKKNCVSLIIFDLDHFKAINDQYSHSVGDTVLGSVAKTLLESVRDSDVACRIGGEEFAVVCRDTNMHEVRITAENLRKKFEKLTIHSNQYNIKITASFGMMTYSSLSGPSISSDDIYHSADMAMYHSKQQGRNRVSHYSDITVDIKRPSANHS